ncbi:MAG: neutral zinc metallopeptidase [Candidatus Saccharimonadales bacterium]
MKTLPKATTLIAAIAALSTLSLSGCGSDVPYVPPTTPASDTSTTVSDPPVSPAPLPTSDANVDLIQSALPQTTPVTQGNADTAVKAYLETAITSLDQKWSQWFIANGYQEPYLTYNIIGQDDPTVYSSECVMADGSKMTVSRDTPNAFYCSSDVDKTGAIWLPAATFEKMWLGDVLGKMSTNPGDFAAGIVVAHEFGHHVADELATQSEARGETPRVVTGKYKELLADCFAGVWASTLYYDGALDAGDFEEAVAAIVTTGDESPGGIDPHGTSEERVAALKLGYNTESNPGYCINSYWQ